MAADLWKIAPPFCWGADEAHSHPLVVFPDHLSRLKERVSWELDNNSHIEAISVLLTLPREVMETCHDGPSFAAKADLGILNGWGEGHVCGLSGSHC